MPKISIILPVYKVQKYIEKCLDSIINQSFQDFDLIIIDDCGNDESIPMCIDKLKETSINYTIIHHKENAGLSASRNTGIANSSADYLIFIDSDDWIDHSMLEKLYNTAIKHNADLVSCAGLEYWEKTNQFTEMSKPPSGVYSPTEYLDLLFNDKTSSHVWLRLIKRNLFETIKFPVKILFEDVLTMPFIIKEANKVVQIEDQLYFYIQRDSNSSITGSRPTNIAAFLCKLEELQKEFESNSKIKNIITRKFIYKILFFITYKSIQYSENYSECKTDLNHLRKYLKTKTIIYDMLALSTHMRINSIIYLFTLKISPFLLYSSHKKLFHKWY